VACGCAQKHQAAEELAFHGRFYYGCGGSKFKPMKMKQITLVPDGEAPPRQASFGGCPA
jgi:hypothetical protein